MSARRVDWRPGETILQAVRSSHWSGRLIGSGSADGNGNFCVAVNPALYRGEVVMAQDANGTLSQPVVVGRQTYLPAIVRG